VKHASSLSVALMCDQIAWRGHRRDCANRCERAGEGPRRLTIASS